MSNRSQRRRASKASENAKTSGAAFFLGALLGAVAANATPNPPEYDDDKAKLESFRLAAQLYLAENDDELAQRTYEATERCDGDLKVLVMIYAEALIQLADTYLAPIRARAVELDRDSRDPSDLHIHLRDQARSVIDRIDNPERDAA